MWTPSILSASPHFYLLIEDRNEADYMERLVHNELSEIDLKIPISFLNKKPYQQYLLKKAIFSDIKSTFISENWHETLIKYHHPKYISLQYLEKTTLNIPFRFFISKSNLLTAKISTTRKLSGELKISHSSKIEINGLENLGLTKIVTDKYIGDDELNVLEIFPIKPISSQLSFYKKIKTVVEFILLISSFAERRRLTWFKSEGVINNNFVINYNSRVPFYSDPNAYNLISELDFKKFLSIVLKNAESKKVNYLIDLLRSHLSGFDYDISAKIILYNSILERILKNNSYKKADIHKEESLIKLNLYIGDLCPIKDLIDVRNKFAHGDDISNYKSHSFIFENWEKLIDRLLLHELKFR